MQLKTNISSEILLHLANTDPPTPNGHYEQAAREYCLPESISSPTTVNFAISNLCEGRHKHTALDVHGGKWKHTIKDQRFFNIYEFYYYLLSIIIIIIIRKNFNAPFLHY